MAFYLTIAPAIKSNHMASGSHVGEKDADLTIFDAPSASAILGSDASGVVSAFGEAAFVNDEHGEESVGLRIG